MIALVTGATGCIGTELTARLKNDPAFAAVRALVRPGREGALPAGVTPFPGTLDALPRGLGEGVDVVFHLAGRVHDPAAAPEAFHRDNVVGTGHLLDALDPLRPPRFLLFSSVAVYGESTPPEGIAETAHPRPASPYAQSKVQAERLVQAWADSVGAVAALLRVATVYGPGDRGNLGRMMDGIARGRFALVGGGRNRKTCVAVENVAAAALAAAKAPSLLLPSHPFVVADPEPYTLRALAEAMQAAAGMPTRLQSIPLPAALLAARLLGKRAPLTAAQARRLAASNVYRAEALCRIPGYNPVVSLREGMERTASERRQAGRWR